MKAKQIIIIGLGAVLVLSAVLGAISFSRPPPSTITREQLDSQLNALVDSCIQTLPAGTPDCDEQLQVIVTQLCQQESSLNACSDGMTEQYYRTRGIGS